MTHPRLVVFEVDGTLVDSQEQIVGAMQAALTTNGLEALPPAEILAIVGLSLPMAIERLLPDRASEEHMAIAESYRARFVADPASGLSTTVAPLYPGARAVLDALSRTTDTLLGLATGKARRGLDNLVAAHGLGEMFATIQTADGHPSKPDPSMVLTALSETGCHPDATVMVGDTEFDVEMGNAAGVFTIGVTWGYHPVERLRAAGADMIVADFHELSVSLAALGFSD